MKLTIVIEREGEDGLDELFAVGVNDLREHFIPKALHVEPKDIRACWFEHNTNPKGMWKGEKNQTITHQDNLYLRDTRSTEQKKAEASEMLFDAVTEDYRGE